jgi:hypothetical protein
MTEHTPRPDEDPGAGPRRRRILALAVAIGLLFAASVAVLLRILPGPHVASDFLIAGTLATFVSLVVLFAVLIGLAPGTFYRRRPK